MGYNNSNAQCCTTRTAYFLEHANCSDRTCQFRDSGDRAAQVLPDTRNLNWHSFYDGNLSPGCRRSLPANAVGCIVDSRHSEISIDRIAMPSNDPNSNRPHILLWSQERAPSPNRLAGMLWGHPRALIGSGDLPERHSKPDGLDPFTISQSRRVGNPAFPTKLSTSSTLSNT